MAAQRPAGQRQDVTVAAHRTRGWLHVIAESGLQSQYGYVVKPRPDSITLTPKIVIWLAGGPAAIWVKESDDPG